MMIVRWLIKILFWSQAFAGPVIVFGLIAFLVYDKTQNIVFTIILLSIGLIAGVVLAELIRRKYGLENFFARIYGPNEIDKKT